MVLEFADEMSASLGHRRGRWAHGCRPDLIRRVGDGEAPDRCRQRAALQRCMLVALLLILSLTPQNSWPALWTASFVVLSKAESAGQHAAYTLTSTLATGVVIGAAIRWLGLF
jgi:hypothetical protein